MVQYIHEQYYIILESVRFTLNKLLPLLPSILIFGVIFGFAGATTGYSLPLISSMSFVIFAGSAQFVTVLLLLENEPLVSIIVTGIIINLRHLIYGIVIRDRLEMTTLKKFIVAYFLIDESFLVTDMAYRERKQNPSLDLFRVLLTSGIILWVCWNLSTIVGYILFLTYGDIFDIPGNFIVAASFLGFLVDHFRKYPEERLLITVTSAISVILGYILSSSALLITIMVAGSLMAGFMSRRDE